MRTVIWKRRERGRADKQEEGLPTPCGGGPRLEVPTPVSPGLGQWVLLLLGLVVLWGLVGVTPTWAKNLRRIVKFTPGVSSTLQEMIISNSGAQLLARIPALNAVALRLPAQQYQLALDYLTQTPEVEQIEEDAQITAPTEHPEGGTQGLITPATPGAGYPWNLAQINLNLVPSSTKGKDVRIAVLDTGIDPIHPALGNRILGGYNARAGENPQDWIDRNGHGTHIAGIIAASLQGQGVVGVAPGAKLYAVKVLDDTGGGYLSDLISGLLWVYQNLNLNIRVINMSLGFYQGSPLLEQVIQMLDAQGVIMVASVGKYDCSTSAASEGAESEGAESEGGESEGGIVALAAPGRLSIQLNTRKRSASGRPISTGILLPIVEKVGQ